LLTPIPPNYYKISILLSFLFPTIEAHYSFPLQKACRTSILKIELKIMSEEKKEALIILVRLLKRRRKKVKVDPKLGDQ